jgi:hypothetical protein
MGKEDAEYFGIEMQTPCQGYSNISRRGFLVLWFSGGVAAENGLTGDISFLLEFGLT